MQVIPRFLSDLQALKILFGQDSPPLRLIRGIKINSVICGFGDASSGDFGSSWETKKGIKYRFGTWGEDMDSESSNLREFLNLVDTLEKMCEDGLLRKQRFFCSLIILHQKLPFSMDFLRAKNSSTLSGERMKAQGSHGLS